MAGKLGVLMVHGMGVLKPDFASALEEGLRKRLGGTAGRIVWKPLEYHGEFQGHQDAVWERMQEVEIDQKKLRRFFLFYFGDAAATETRPDADDSVYRRVMRRVKGCLDELRAELGSDRPLVVVAQSLGCQVMSNYVWDAQKGIGIWEGGDPPTRFQKCATLRYLITSGCNIPLFVSGLQKIEAIRRPNRAFEWHNYYDRDDILGWPLRPLSQGFANSYQNIVTRDHEINVGFTPLGHSDYWEDGSFLDPVADKLAALAAAV